MSLIKKIVISGPESSGKTTLAMQLAAYFDTQWVPEYARTYLQELKRPYRQDDLLIIARQQAAMEDQLSRSAKKYLFCDTGIEVIKIWSLVKYKEVDPQIESILNRNSYSTYLLCQPDLDWEPDPLRETPAREERRKLYELYKQEIIELAIPWVSISGSGKTRLEQAIQALSGR